MTEVGSGRMRDAELALILDQLPAAVWATDQELRLESIAGAAVKGLEGTFDAWTVAAAAGELAGEPAAVVQAHRRALAGEATSLEAAVRGRAFMVHVAPRRDEAGAVTGCLGVAFEITERVRTEKALERARQELEQQVSERTRDSERALAELRMAEEELRQQHAELRSTEEELRHQYEELLESRRAQERERRRYRALFEFAPYGYLVTDPSGVIQEVNRVAGELFERPAESLQGKPLVVLVGEAERTRFLSALGQAHAEPTDGGKRVELELDLLRNGDAFRARLSAAPAYDLDGSLAGWRWMVRDITARVRAAEEREQLLAEAQEQRTRTEELAAELDQANRVLNQLLDRMPVGVVVCDENGKILTTNRHGEAILGAVVTGEALGPKRSYAAFYPDGSPYPDNATPLVRAMRDGEVVTDEEILIRRHEGTEATILVGAAPVRDERGEIVRGVAVFQDITARKAAENRIRELLRESEEQRKQAETLTALLRDEWDLVRTVMESTDTNLAYLDRDFSFVRVNSAYAAGSGYSPEELLHRNHFELFPNAENQAIFERVRETGEPFSIQAKPFEFPGHPERGVTYWDWSLVPAFGDDGEVRGLILSVRDVTERERLLEENRRQRDFLEHLIYSAPVGIAVVRGAEHRYDLVNRHYQEIPGFDTGPMKGRTLAEMFPDPSVSEAGGAMLETVYRENRVVSMREYLASVGPGREETWWNFDMVPLHDADGRVGGVLIITWEITEQVRGRRAAEAQAARDEAILTSMADGLIVFDAAGEILEINPAAMRIHRLERPADEPWMIDSVLNELEMRDLSGKRLPTERWPTARIRAGEVFGGYEVEIRHTGSGYTWVGSYSGTAVYDQQGSFALGVLTVRDVTAQKRAEEEREWLLARLEGERARLETIFEQAPEGIVVADRGAKVLMTNPAAERLYERPAPTDMSVDSDDGLQICQADGTPYDPRALPLTCSALDGVTIREEEMVISWPDGQRRDLLVNAAPIRNKAGEIAGAVGIFQDITERKQTRERVRRLATRLEALHELDRAILAARDPKEIAEVTLPFVGRLVSGRRASVALFDLEQDEAQMLAVTASGGTKVGAGWKSAVEGVWPMETLAQGKVHVERGPSLNSPLMGALQAEGITTYASVPLVAQGQLVGALDVGSERPDGLHAEEIEVLREVADHLAIGIRQAFLHAEVARYAEQLERMVARRTARLRISEARFQTVFEGVAIGIALVDRKGQIMETNPAWKRILGHEEEALQQRGLADLIDMDELVDVGADVFEKLMTGEREEPYRTEVRYRGSGGRSSWGNLTVSAVCDIEGRPRFLVAMLEDITERKEAEEALLRTEKLAVTGRLAASMVHEINNPLQAVVGCLALADETLEAGGDPGEYLQIAREELRRTAGIVDQLRDIHRRSQPREKQLTNLRALLEQVIALNRERLERQRVQVIREWAPEPIMVPLVADRMQQVFLNLILNAAEAMEDGGKLRISINRTEEPGGVTIAFADTGPGIPSDMMDSLYEPFFSTKEEGVGLGLYITRNIVEQHGGRIAAESVEGEGTRFDVWVPNE
jgi:PAS domain S-box-containing protein